ncbi:MAG: chemotaxis protein CheW [Prochloraceae cyanobacterium]
MALYSSVRSRRFAAIEKESTKQIISFRLLGEYFALPINSVQKVTPLTQVYGDPNKIGVSLTQYQGQELLVLDIDRIFQNLFPKTKSDLNQQRFLLVVENKAKDIIGLPIDSPPSLRRVPLSGFVSLPQAYSNKGNIRFLSSSAIQLEDNSSLLLLDPEKLFK